MSGEQAQDEVVEDLETPVEDTDEVTGGAPTAVENPTGSVRKAGGEPIDF